MKRTITLGTFLILLFLSGGGLYGGWMLVSAPGGEKFGWTAALLENTPFDTYLIPGLILFLINGCLPLTIAILLLLKNRNLGWLLFLQGCLLVGWLTAEIIFDRALFVVRLHITFYAVGALLILSGLLQKPFQLNPIAKVD